LPLKSAASVAADKQNDTSAAMPNTATFLNDNAIATSP
jgi:hypothetical protein